MTMAWESNGGEWLKQEGNGPAYGVYQLEEGTFKDIWERYLTDKPSLIDRIFDVCNLNHAPQAADMAGNLYLATAIARIFYLRVHEPIPQDITKLSEYVKKFWNSEAGKAKATDYEAAYLRFNGLPSRPAI